MTYTLERESNESGREFVERAWREIELLLGPGITYAPLWIAAKVNELDNVVLFSYQYADIGIVGMTFQEGVL